MTKTKNSLDCRSCLIRWSQPSPCQPSPGGQVRPAGSPLLIGGTSHGDTGGRTCHGNAGQRAAGKRAARIQTDGPLRTTGLVPRRGQHSLPSRLSASKHRGVAIYSAPFASSPPLPIREMKLNVSLLSPRNGSASLSFNGRGCPPNHICQSHLSVRPSVRLSVPFVLGSWLGGWVWAGQSHYPRCSRALVRSFVCLPA